MSVTHGEENNAQKSRPEDFKRGILALISYLRQFRRIVIIASVLAVLQALADGVAPFLVGKLFDAILDTDSYIELPFAVVPLWIVFMGLLVTAWLAGGLLGWAVDRKRRTVGTDLAAFYPAQAVKRILRLPVSFHKAERTGEVTERLQRARSAVSNLIEQLAIGVAPEMLSVVVGLTIAFFIHPLLAAILVAGVGIYVATLVRIVPPMIPLQKEGNKQWRESWGMAFDAVGNYQAVKQGTAEQYEADRINEKFMLGAAAAWKRVEHIWSGITFYQRILIVITQTALIGFAIYFIRTGELSIGDLIALNGYAGMLFGPFMRLGFQWQQIQDGIINISHAENMLSLPPERAYGDGKSLGVVDGRVEFDAVSFSYPDDLSSVVLRDVSFSVKPGEVVALVGESGVGKSTTIELLSGYYYPTGGRILVDGHDTRELDLASLRRHIAVVAQEPTLFNDTVEMNIKYGAFEASDDAVYAASKGAHAHEFIEKFPQKYEQLVGERGVKLSVGQKQRIAIARAILRNPKILILDEPTSALDAKTEQFITESLEKLMAGRTTFIIAHRLSTVRTADKIIVFKNGEIVEQGTHDELVNTTDGVYRRLYEYQIGLHA